MICLAGQVWAPRRCLSSRCGVAGMNKKKVLGKGGGSSALVWPHPLSLCTSSVALAFYIQLSVHLLYGNDTKEKYKCCKYHATCFTEPYQITNACIFFSYFYICKWLCTFILSYSTHLTVARLQSFRFGVHYLLDYFL